MCNPIAADCTKFLAGAEGLEPSTKVLETHVLPLHHAPSATIWNYTRPSPFCQEKTVQISMFFCRSVKHRLQQVRKEQSRERWRFAKQIQPDLDCGKKEIQWEGAVRQSLPNSLGCFISRRACSSWLYHMTPSYFASTWLGDCMPRHVMIWSLDCRWYTASCFLPSSRLYIRICR